MAYYFGNAVSDIKNIKGKKDGHLDLASLPAFAKKKITYKDKATGKVVTEDGRDLGAMVSMLTKAVQELDERIGELERVRFETERAGNENNL